MKSKVKHIKIEKPDAGLTGEGVELEGGKVVMYWSGKIDSIVIYNYLDDLLKLHSESTVQISELKPTEKSDK